MSKKIRLEKRDIRKKLAENFGDSFETFKKGGNITIYDDKEIYIDGCYGILEITDENLKISIGKKTVKISGNNFNIKDFTDKSITICGDIDGLIFCK